MELETDKAVVEVPSSVTGTVGEVRVKEGDKLRVGQVIFTVENGAGVSKQTAAAAPAVPPAVGGKKQTASRAPASSSSPAATTPAPASPATSASTPGSSLSPASDFKLPELGENIDSGDLVRLMISPGARVAEGQPVMELETDKAVVEVPSSVSGVVREVKVKEGQKVKVGQVIFTLEGGSPAPVEAPRRHQPVEHISGQQAARLSFQLAMKAEGKTEEAGAAARSAAGRAARIPYARATRQGCRHRASRSCARRAARAPSGARNWSGHSQRAGKWAGWTDQRRGREAAREKCAGRRYGCGIGSACWLRRAGASRLFQVGQDRARFHARRAPQDRRASSPGLEHDSACHAAGSRRHHRTRAACARASLRAPKRPAAR